MKKVDGQAEDFKSNREGRHTQPDDDGEQSICNAARSHKLYGCSLHVGTLPANALQDGKAATLAPSQRRGGSVSWRAYELRHDTMRYESRV